jgi:hypothetical protein
MMDLASEEDTLGQGSTPRNDILRVKDVKLS